MSIFNSRGRSTITTESSPSISANNNEAATSALNSEHFFTGRTMVGSTTLLTSGGLLSRLYNLAKGFFGLFVAGAERKNPEALLELEKENLRKSISKFNQGLAAQAGLCENIMAQVKKAEKEEQELRAQTAANLKANNVELAGQYALRLQKVSQTLAENRKNQAALEAQYNELKTARDTCIAHARRKIEVIKAGINDIKIKDAQASLLEMAQSSLNSLGGAGDNLQRIDELIQTERTKAAGRARLAKDSIDLTEIKAKESEQKALAAQALIDFQAKEGIILNQEAFPKTAPRSEIKPPVENLEMA